VKNIFNRIRSFLDNRKALKQLNINDAIFTVLDTETTGLNVNEGHKIVSVGGIKIKSYQLLEDQILDELINPERDIPFASRNIHYISDDQVKDKPNIYQLEKKISNFLENTILVGHNVDFDIGFIKKKCCKNISCSDCKKNSKYRHHLTCSRSLSKS